MALLVSDANIFIDFEEGGLLRELFALSDRIGVPDVLFEDEFRDQHEHLLDHGLELLELGSIAIVRTVELASRYSHPSRLDIAALALAEQEGRSCPPYCSEVARELVRGARLPQGHGHPSR